MVTRREPPEVAAVRRRCSAAAPGIPGDFSTVRTAMHVMTPEGIICETNPAFDRMFRVPRGEFLGTHLAALSPASLAAVLRLLAAMRVGVGDDGVWAGRLENCRQDGTTFATRAQVHPMRVGHRRYLVCLQEALRVRSRPASPPRARREGAAAWHGCRPASSLGREAAAPRAAGRRCAARRP